FEPGLASFGQDTVLAAIGLQVVGADFGRLDPTERREAIGRLLWERRLLVIFDNFESVHTMPDPDHATPPLAEAQRDELRRFIAQVAASERSGLLITSRTPESWLDTDSAPLRRIEISGLSLAEANQYTDQLLTPYPRAGRQRTRRAFGDLLE